MIRIENNRADKLFLKEYLHEIENAVITTKGLDDFNGYRQNFEKYFARFIGAPYAAAVHSGTDALQLALLVCGIGKGDSVIVPDLSYIATGLAVRYVGAEPILVDVKTTDLTIDEKKVSAVMRADTKAIIAVHMFGHPCQMKKLKTIAKSHNILLIEDACQAIGSIYDGKKVGTFGDLAAFSFSYYKPLSSLVGNGGMLTFQKKEYEEKLSAFLDAWKIEEPLVLSDKKFNKMAFLDIVTTQVKLKYFEKIVASRRRTRELYEKYLHSIKQIKFFSDEPGCQCIFENFLILTGKYRDRLYRHLSKNGVKTDLPYLPLHLTPMCSCRGAFGVTMRYYQEALHLPLYSFMLESECQRVISLINSFF